MYYIYSDHHLQRDMHYFMFVHHIIFKSCNYDCEMVLLGGHWTLGVNNWGVPDHLGCNDPRESFHPGRSHLPLGMNDWGSQSPLGMYDWKSLAPRDE